MLDSESLSALVPIPPKVGAPRKSVLRKRRPADVLDADAFGHLSSLTSGWSGSTVDGLIKAVRKEAADYVVARETERKEEAARMREAAAKTRRSSVVGERRRGSVMSPPAGANEADPVVVLAPAPPDMPSGRVSPLSPRQPDGASTRGGAVPPRLRPARDHALQLEEAQRAAATERIAQCRRLAALPSAPKPDDFAALGAHYAQQGEHDRAAATFFQGLFRDGADQVLAERFRQSISAIARMRHPDQRQPDLRFLPELRNNRHGNRQGVGLTSGLTASEEAAQRRQPGRTLILKNIKLSGLAGQNGPFLRIRHGGGDVWSEEDEGAELCRADLDHLCRVSSLIAHGIPSAGEEPHHSRDATARRLRPDGAARGALSTPCELQTFPRAR